MGLRFTNTKRYPLYLFTIVIITFGVFPVIVPSGRLIKDHNLTIKPLETIEHPSKNWLNNSEF